VLVSFPQILSAWPQAATGAMDTLAAVFLGRAPGAGGWDAVTGATALDTVRNGLAAGQDMDQIRQSPAFGRFAGQDWEWIALAYAAGGAWLLWRRVIGWQVPAGLLAAVSLFSAAGWLLDPAHNPSPLFDLLSGAVILGAFFIATDPVSGCTSDRGRLLFGAGVGILTLVIRRWGGYPDGIAFAVLLMNLSAPLIDRFTRPRIFGHD
jgi:electron transport complex protein RnfD